MFKKPLSDLKTSAPLRSSDRRKLKQHVASTFKISSDEADILVPDGILSVKFSTHLDEPGVAYLNSEGDPIWFTIGKGSDDLVPTVYTLWKNGELLPSLSTPASVIPVLVGGADLMIPGVILCPPSLNEGELVSVRQYTRVDGTPMLSPPLCVGRMALPSDRLVTGGTGKGKAVHILHTWNDNLWEMGSKGDIPQGAKYEVGGQVPEISDDDDPENQRSGGDLPPSSAIESETASALTPVSVDTPGYTPHEITELLQRSLLQAISSLSTQPPSTFPIPATTFYTNYILPSRPAYPTLLLMPSSASREQKTGRDFHIDPQDINIKTSTHKSLTTFLKAAEKSSLLTLKAPPKHAQQSDLMVTAIKAAHPSVDAHRSFATVKDIEQTAAKKAAKEEIRDTNSVLLVRELWKAHQASIDLIEAMGGNKRDLYSLTEIKSLLNNYISSHNLVNARDQAYINLDSLLLSCVSAKSKGKSKKDSEAEPLILEFMKRDELTKKVTSQMQSWHEVKVEGKDAVSKKGELKPIQVVMKIRQGRKASTVIVGFEPFIVIDAEEMAEELRKTCAGATSVSPVPGKPANSGLEVLVQGKQAPAVVEYLTSKGIPKKWIEVSDLSGKK